MSDHASATITLRQELMRKLVHLSSLWMPLVIAIAPRPYAMAMLMCAALPVVVLDVARNFMPEVQAVVLRWFGRILREHERTAGQFSLTGASYMLMAALTCVTLFSQPVAVCAMLVLVLADTSAALVGRRWGRIRLMDKSLEGCAAFFVVAYLCVVFVGLFTDDPAQFMKTGLLAVAGATLVELASKRIGVDDNLLIPIAFAMMMVGV